MCQACRGEACRDAFACRLAADLSTDIRPAVLPTGVNHFMARFAPDTFGIAFTPALQRMEAWAPTFRPDRWLWEPVAAEPASPPDRAALPPRAQAGVPSADRQTRSALARRARPAAPP